jgi:voltage-gated potassium channel
MSTDQALGAGQLLSRAQQRRLLWWVLVRSLAGVVVLVALYYAVPLQDLRAVPVWRSLSVGLLILAVVIVLQVRGVTRARYPGVRAVEALAVTAPLFLLMFASAYVVLAQADAANFSTHQLTRTDALYFTVTVFSTVGFGDITATSRSARVFVMVQMVLDLVILGLGVQVYRGAVRVGRKRSGTAAGGQPGEQDRAEGVQP